MKSALTRLTLLVGASLVLCVSSGSGVALAVQALNQPTNAAQNQYLETFPKIHHPKRKTSTSKPPASRTTSTASSKTPSTPVGEETSTTGVSTTRHTTTRPHHKRTRQRTKKPGKSKVKHKSAANRRARDLSFKPAHVAAATGSSGGISVWLLVILGLVLVSGSAAGILRYRHNR